MLTSTKHRIGSIERGKLVPDMLITPESRDLRDGVRLALRENCFGEVKADVFSLGREGQVVSLEGSIEAARKNDFVDLVSSFRKPQSIMYVLRGLADRFGKIPVSPELA